MDRDCPVSLGKLPDWSPGNLSLYPVWIALVFNFSIASCPTTIHHLEETGSLFLTPSLETQDDRCLVPLKPPFLLAEGSPASSPSFQRASAPVPDRRGDFILNVLQFMDACLVSDAVFQMQSSGFWVEENNLFTKSRSSAPVNKGSWWLPLLPGHCCFMWNTYCLYSTKTPRHSIASP